MQNRLDILRTLILTRKITCQEDLRQGLAKHGIYVDQPTIARDLKRIKAIKQKTPDGPRYRLTSDEKVRPVILRHDLPEMQLASTTLSMDFLDEPVQIVIVSHQNKHDEIANLIKKKLES